MNRSLLVCLGLLARFFVFGMQGRKPVESIAFGSCLKQTRPQPIWESVRQASRMFSFCLGTISTGIPAIWKKLKGKWDAFAAVPGFKKLRSDCRLLAIWDDHDYGENDAGREFPQKAESQQIFLDFLREPKDSERRKTPGIYDSVTIGPKGKTRSVHPPGHPLFPFAAQTRPKREKGKGPYGPNESDQAEILGEAQWKWLEKTLREPAEVRIIASSIQVVSTTHGWETWGNFPKERNACSIC